jgi:hypothetical protein
MTTLETKPRYLPGSIETTENIEPTSKSKFQAQFQDGEIGIPLSYYGEFDQQVPKFKSSNAQLHEVNPTNSFTFIGTLGPDKILLNLDNGSSIEGNLDRGIDESIEVSGKGERFTFVPK